MRKLKLRRPWKLWLILNCGAENVESFLMFREVYKNVLIYVFEHLFLEKNV